MIMNDLDDALDLSDGVVYTYHIYMGLDWLNLKVTH